MSEDEGSVDVTTYADAAQGVKKELDLATGAVTELPFDYSDAQPHVPGVGSSRRAKAAPLPERSRRSKNNRARGTSDELVVAKLLGGRKIGPMGLPWDVEVPGWMRAQCKRLDKWPSINAILAWLDAIPQEPELRAVTLADTPGAGYRTRRLIVMDLDEFARWYAGRKADDAQ